MTTEAAVVGSELTPRAKGRVGKSSPYPFAFYLPAAVIYGVFFLVPTVTSFYFSLTRWTLFDVQFIGLDNFQQFFREPALVKGFINTFIYAFVTCGAKVILGLLLGAVLSSQIIARGFPAQRDLLSRAGQLDRRRHHVEGADGSLRRAPQPGTGHDRAARPRMADRPVDCPPVRCPGGHLAGRWPGDADLHRGDHIHPPGGLRGRGGRRRECLAEVPQGHRAAGAACHHHGTYPVAHRRVEILRPDLDHDKGRTGFTSDVVASVIYKQYQAGFFGLSTAGNVVLFIVVVALVVPLQTWLNRGNSER